MKRHTVCNTAPVTQFIPFSTHPSRPSETAHVCCGFDSASSLVLANDPPNHETSTKAVDRVHVNATFSNTNRFKIQVAALPPQTIAR